MATEISETAVDMMARKVANDLHNLRWSADGRTEKIVLKKMATVAVESLSLIRFQNDAYVVRGGANLSEPDLERIFSLAKKISKHENVAVLAGDPKVGVKATRNVLACMSN